MAKDLPSSDIHVKRARQESEDEEGALAEQSAKRRMKDTAREATVYDQRRFAHEL